MMKYLFYFSLAAIILSLGQANTQDFWQQTNGPAGKKVRSLAINASGHIFAGLEESSGVFRSTDNGESWRQVGLTQAFQVLSLVISSDGHIFAGTWGSGVFRSVQSNPALRELTQG